MIYSIDLKVSLPAGEIDARKFNPTNSVGDELYSLLDAIGSESIAEQFHIGQHSAAHDFDKQPKTQYIKDLIRRFLLSN